MVERTRAALLRNPPRGDGPCRPLQAVPVVPAASTPAENESHLPPVVMPQDIVDDPFAWETVNLAQQDPFEPHYEYSVLIDNNMYWFGKSESTARECSACKDPKRQPKDHLRCKHDFEHFVLEDGLRPGNWTLDKCTFDKFLDFLGTEPGSGRVDRERLRMPNTMIPIYQPPGFSDLVNELGVSHSLGLNPKTRALTVLKHLVQKAEPIRCSATVNHWGNLQFANPRRGGTNSVPYNARYITCSSCNCNLVLSIVRRKMKLPFDDADDEKRSLLKLAEERG